MKCSALPAHARGGISRFVRLTGFARGARLDDRRRRDHRSRSEDPSAVGVGLVGGFGREGSVGSDACSLSSGAAQGGRSSSRSSVPALVGGRLGTNGFRSARRRAPDRSPVNGAARGPPSKKSSLQKSVKREASSEALRVGKAVAK